MEEGAHGLVVADAFGVGAADDAAQGRGHTHVFLLHNLVAADYGKRHVGRDYGELVELFVGEEAVGHFDDTFQADAFALEIQADGDCIVVVLVQMEQIDNLKYLIARNVIYNGAVFKCGYKKLTFHS